MKRIYVYLLSVITAVLLTGCSEADQQHYTSLAKENPELAVEYATKYGYTEEDVAALIAEPEEVEEAPAVKMMTAAPVAAEPEEVEPEVEEEISVMTLDVDEEPVVEEIVEEPEEVEPEVEEFVNPVVGEIAVGNKVYLGRYEQDGDLSNGPEEIEWYVYYADGNTAKLAATHILDAMKFANTDSINSYEESNVYAWTNGALLADFTENELSIITCSRVPCEAEGTICYASLTKYANSHYEWIATGESGDSCWYSDFGSDRYYQRACIKKTNLGVYQVVNWMYTAFRLNERARGVQPVLEITY